MSFLLRPGVKAPDGLRGQILLPDCKVQRIDMLRLIVPVHRVIGHPLSAKGGVHRVMMKENLAGADTVFPDRVAEV